MPHLNKSVLLMFWGGLTAVVVIYSIWDMWLASHTDAGTISWSMALLGQRHPFLVFVIGHLTGAILWGLAVHFWPEMPSPEDWATYVQQRDEIRKLKTELATYKETNNGPVV